MIDWTTIKAELGTVMSTISGVPPAQIKWRDESGGAMWVADPTLMLRLSTVTRQGIEEDRWADDASSVTMCGQRRFTLNLRCESFNQDVSSVIFAGNVLDKIAMRVMRPSTRALITSFAIENRLGTTFFSYKSDGRQVACYVQDWQLRTVDNDTDDTVGATDYINEVIGTGTYNDADGAGGAVTDNIDVIGS